MIGNRIKKLREELDLKQDELAKKLGVSPSAVGMYERDLREANDDIKLRMCNLFNCSMDYLTGKSDLRNYDKDEQEFRFAYHKEMEGLSEQEIADALKFYKEMKKRVGGNDGTK